MSNEHKAGDAMGVDFISSSKVQCQQVGRIVML